MPRREQTFDTDDRYARERRAQELEQEHARRPMREYAELIPEPGFGPLNFALFPYQQEWYSDEVADAEEVVVCKSTQVGMCLAPDTRVLTADLRWVPIGGLQPGDGIVTVDEEPVGVGRPRCLRAGRVVAARQTEEPVARLTLSDGTEVVASLDHRWLVRHQAVTTSGARVCSDCGRGFSSVIAVSMHKVRAHGYRPGHNRRAATRWAPVSEIAVGDRIRRIVEPWDAPTYEDGWFGGIIDGEGHLASAGTSHSLRRRATGSELVIAQQLGPVHDRVTAYLRARGVSFNEQVSTRPSGKPVGHISITLTRDTMRLIGLTRPTRFIAQRWWLGLMMPGVGWRDTRETWPEVVAIEPMGEREVVDLQTTHGTFIAEGLVSHNSAYAWRWAVRRSDQFGETGVYIFPTDTHVTEFGDERIEPAIDESQYLRSRIAPRFVRHKRLKRIGRGFLHLRGSNSKAGAQSVAATWLVFDEYDFLDQTNLPQIERRISGARQLGRHPRIRRLGTPTIDGDGISAAFDGSDKRIWHVTCEGCGVEQPVAWEENVRWRSVPDGEVRRPGRDEFENVDDVAEVWRQCKACEERLDVSRGRWIATDPERTVIGFHATRLIVPNTDLRQIVIASRRTKPQDVITFENNDLGRPFTAGEWSLSQAMLLAACELGGPMLEAYTGWLPITMGVDVAGERDLSVRIDEQLPAEHPSVPNPRRAVWIGEVKSFDALMRLIDLFRPQVIAIDDNPERRMAKALRASYVPGRVVLVHYNENPDVEALKVETGPAGTALEGVPLSVAVHRTEAIDAMMDAIRQLRDLPLRNPPPRWFEQMRALKRKTVIDTKGRARRVYVTTGSAGDDYAHANVYALVATELWRLRGGVAAMNPPERRIPDEEIGFRRVRLADDVGVGTYHAGLGGDQDV